MILLLQSILSELKDSSVITVMDLANKLGTDRQSVMAALEQLQRMGYIIDMTKLSCGKRSCEGCSDCDSNFNKAVGAVYVLR